MKDMFLRGNRLLILLLLISNFIHCQTIIDVPDETNVITDEWDISSDNAYGGSIGEMDAILLQKIEGLTLYMIELKKENDVLKKEM